MKIEVEIDEGIYSGLIKIIGPDLDIGIMLAGMLRSLVILFAVHPEEATAMFGEITGGPQGTPEGNELIETTLNKEVLKILKKANKKT